MKHTQISKTVNCASVAMIVTTLAFICFIFTHSLTPAAASSEESGSVMNGLNGFFAALNIGTAVTDYIVRKSAHFLEFAVYGLLLTCTIQTLAKNCRIPKSTRIFAVLFFGLAIPVADETIQYFSPGRSPQVNDVLLDFCGVITACTMVILIMFIKSLIKKHKHKQV